MNEQTAALLRDLAAKLGTTVEHLWAVVLKQVPLWIAENIMWALLTGVLAAWLLSVGLAFVRPPVERADQWTDDALIPRGVCGALIICVAALVFGFGVVENVYGALTGLFNPEFAALAYILNRSGL